MTSKLKWTIFVILILAFILRFFKLSELFYFTMDESLVAFRALGLFEYSRPFLIGGISPLQVHLPPYFYYLAAVLLWPFNFNPLGWGVWAAIIGTTTVYALFILAKKMTNQTLAIWASLFYAVSFTAVFADRHFWPLTLNPLLVILSLLFFLQKKLILLGLTLTFAVTADPSNLPLALILLILLFKDKATDFKQLKKSLVVAAIVFFTPLILFDMRHNWQNFSGVSRLFDHTKAYSFSLENLTSGLLLMPQALARFWYSPQTDITQIHSYCSLYANDRLNLSPQLIALAAVVIFISAKQFKLLSPLTSIYIFGIALFSLFGFSIFEHYLNGFLPLFALMTAYAISLLPRKIGYLLVALFVALNLWQISKAHNPYGLKHKQDLVTWAQVNLRDKPFILDSISKCHKENGLRYLLEINEPVPVQSFMDPHFFWLYKNPTGDQAPYVLLLSDKEELPDQTVLQQSQFGAIKAYILDNSAFTYQLFE